MNVKYFHEAMDLAMDSHAVGGIEPISPFALFCIESLQRDLACKVPKGSIDRYQTLWNALSDMEKSVMTCNRIQG